MVRRTAGQTEGIVRTYLQGDRAVAGISRYQIAFICNFIKLFLECHYEEIDFPISSKQGPKPVWNENHGMAAPESGRLAMMEGLK